MSSDMTCPNQFVTNEVQLFRNPSNNGIDGRAVDHSLDNGRLRGRASAYSGCDGFDSTPFPDVFPDACFEDSIFWDPPPPGGGGGRGCHM